MEKWEQDDDVNTSNKLSKLDVEDDQVEIKNSSDRATEGMMSSSQYELTDELKLSFDQWSNASKFGCRACHKTFPTPSCLGSHIRKEHHNQIFQYALYDCQSKVAKQHACKLCSITLIQNKAILATHLMRRHNISVLDYYCEYICDGKKIKQGKDEQNTKFSSNCKEFAKYLSLIVCLNR